MNNSVENQFYDLLALKLSGDASNEQLLLLEQLLKAHPEFQFLYDQMLKPSPDYTDELTAPAYAAHMAKMQVAGKLEVQDEPARQTPAPVRTSRLLYKKLGWITGIAAALIGIYFFSRVDDVPDTGKKLAVNEVSTRKGSKSNVTLRDGTQVWLNADSRLIYPQDFGDTTREVELIGEAYFDVAHDVAHPFIIHAGKANIKVLGTAFNVRNYPQDKSMETTLMRGKIEVTIPDRPDEKIILHPLDKLIIAKEPTQNSTAKTTKPDINSPTKVILTSVTYAHKDSAVAETSWLKDKMIFVNQPLQNIAEEMERRFAISISFKTDRAKEYRYTGEFTDESVEEIFHILQLSRKINYTINDKKIVIE